jgi:hypothetical protein
MSAQTVIRWVHWPVRAIPPDPIGRSELSPAGEGHKLMEEVGRLELEYRGAESEPADCDVWLSQVQGVLQM